MFLHSKIWRTLIFILSFLSLPTWADNESNAHNNNDLCYFYEFIKGTSKHSDPANQVSYFIKNRWLELEIDLARGHGEELAYLNGLAMCPYQLTENFWETQLKGLPYDQRSITFTKIFMSQCFCTWK